jgi:charged multivesicular body protein 4
MNLFGRKKKNTAVNPSCAIQTLQETLEVMEKREAHLEKQIDSFTTQAKKAMQVKKKPRALHFLRKKKLLEKQLTSIFNTKMNVEVQIAALIQAVNNTQTVSALSKGRDALQSMESKVDPDKVADVVDDIEERLAMVDEVSDAMSRPIGQLVDEDDLLAELEAEMQEDALLKEVTAPVVIPQIPQTPQVATLPAVPTTPVKTKEQLQEEREEQELKELEMLMST